MADAFGQDSSSSFSDDEVMFLLLLLLQRRQRRLRASNWMKWTCQTYMFFQVFQQFLGWIYCKTLDFLSLETSQCKGKDNQAKGLLNCLPKLLQQLSQWVSGNYTKTWHKAKLDLLAYELKNSLRAPIIIIVRSRGVKPGSHVIAEIDRSARFSYWRSQRLG